MNWIKRNWPRYGAGWIANVAIFVTLCSPLVWLTAHAQKPEPPKNWRGETREDYCKANPDGVYSEGNGDMATPCRMDGAFQKPETEIITADEKEATYTGMLIYIRKPKDTTKALSVEINGRHVADWNSKGVLNIAGLELDHYIEQHCVAVLTEKHTVHHKLEPSPPHFDDRTEWDDEIPEQTLKLHCQ